MYMYVYIYMYTYYNDFCMAYEVMSSIEIQLYCNSPVIISTTQNIQRVYLMATMNACPYWVSEPLLYNDGLIRPWSCLRGPKKNQRFPINFPVLVDVLLWKKNKQTQVEGGRGLWKITSVMLSDCWLLVLKLRPPNHMTLKVIKNRSLANMTLLRVEIYSCWNYQLWDDGLSAVAARCSAAKRA